MLTDYLEMPILAQKEIGKEGKLLSLEKRSDFIPGQVLGLSFKVSDPLRWYSLASSPLDKTWDILYTKQQDGFLTPRLWRAQGKQNILVHPPRGGFVLGKETSYWMVANGTGIAPFYSMLRFLQETDPDRIKDIVLVHGVRFPEDAYFRDYFSDLVTKFSLTYILCLSAAQKTLPHPGVTNTEIFQASQELVFPGRLSVWLELYLLGESLPPSVPVMLCGSSGMVNDVRDLLTSNGHNYESILGEIYF